MKKNWTIRIVIFTVVCFGLALIFAKISGEDNLRRYWKNGVFKYSKEEKRSAITEDISVSDVNEVEIFLTSADIKIVKSADEKVHLSYSKKSNVKNEKLFSKDGAKLKIDLNREENSHADIETLFNLADFKITVQDAYEKVQVQIPANIKKLKIETVSGEIKIADVDIESVAINSISSDFKTSDSSIKEIKYTSVSGDVSLLGNIHKIESETVSGDLKFTSDLPNPDVKFSTTSGDASIIFSKNPDVNITFESTSGEINFFGGLSTAKLEGDVKNYKLGKGTAPMKFETVSGDVKISKIEE